MSALTVVMVMDVPDRERSYEAALRARGYHVVNVRNAMSAPGVARASNPCCIVIDDRLADASGWDLCARLKGERRLNATPIIVVAQNATRNAAEEGRRARCNAWLVRPTHSDDLVRAIQQVLASGESEPPDPESSLIGISACPACASENIRAGVSVGPVQYYCCRQCALCWRVEVRGEQTA